jgi:hypothetical protein
VLPPSDDVPRRRPRWGYTEYLLADLADLLSAGNWQRGGGGTKPRPYPRPTDIGGNVPSSSLTVEQLNEMRSRARGGTDGG